MAKSDWLNPATVLAAAGLLLSIVSLVLGQLDKGRISALEQAQFSLDKWRTEAQVEIDQAAEERASRAADVGEGQRAKLERELAKVVEEVAVWEGGVTDTQTNLLALQMELQQYQSENRPIMVEATLKSIDAAKTVLAMQEGELAASRARRGEIEAKLY